MNFSPVWKTLQQIINGIIVAIPSVVVALAVFIVLFFVAKGIRFSIERLTVKCKRTRALGRVLGRVAQGSIVFLGLLVALVIIFPSFKPVDVINLLGISGVAIGFAFRDILQNFLAGILLLLTEPFRIGDQIIVTSFEGTVEDIQTRATMIRTYDGRRVVIPNAQLFTQSVIVNTAFTLRRLEYDLDIDPTNNVERAKELILEAISSVQGVGVLKEPAPDALVVALAANALTVRARRWIEPPRRADTLDTRDTVLMAIKKKFDEHGIVLPIQNQQISCRDRRATIEGRCQSIRQSIEERTRTRSEN